MEIFQPLIVCGSLSMLLIALCFFAFVVGRCHDIEQLRKENDILNNTIDVLKRSREVDK